MTFREIMNARFAQLDSLALGAQTHQRREVRIWTSASLARLDESVPLERQLHNYVLLGPLMRLPVAQIQQTVTSVQRICSKTSLVQQVASYALEVQFLNLDLPSAHALD